MAAQRLSRENIKTLQGCLGDITEDDCKILIEEYGSNNADVTEIAQAIFDVMDTSGFESASDLIWNIKQNQKPGSSAQIDTPPAAQAMMMMPYSSGTNDKNPIQILKTRCKRVDADITTLRLYMSNYLQDAESRNLLYDVYEQKSPKLLILIRGASGSGKSTLASIMFVISEGGEICSADNYFTKRNGNGDGEEYVFNKNALGEAHETCRMACQAALQKGDSPIIIDNTNTRVEEMLPYVELAVAYNYDIKIVEPQTEWKNEPLELWRKTVHGVPKRTIQRQLGGFEKTTVKTMVERVLKEQGLPMGSYRPRQNMEWEGGGEAVPSPPPFTSIAPTKPIQGFPVDGTSTCTSTKLTITPSTSTQSSWIDPPSVITSPTPIMLSDLVPDLKNGVSNSGGPKKRSGKRNNGNSTGKAASTNPSSSSSQIDKIRPGPVPLVFEDPTHIIAFENLCKHFPVIPRDELEKFLHDHHEGDADACVLALIEEGFEFADSSDDVPTPTAQVISAPSVLNEGHPSPTIDDWDSLVSIRNYDMSVPTSFDGGSRRNSNQPTTSIVAMANDDAGRVVPFNGVFIDSDSESNSSSESSITTEDESDGFDIELPIHFGRMLLRAFGHPDDELRELTQDELTIKLGADTAFEIYKALYINMHNNADNDNDTPRRSNNSTDEAGSNSPSETHQEVEDEFDFIASSLSQMELDTTTMSNDDDFPQLASVMNIESKLNSQQAEQSLQFVTAAPFRNMAQNINFSRLKQEYYPRLDEAMIDEIYCQCGLSMEMTRAALNEVYPPLPSQPSQNNSAADQQQSCAQEAVSNNSSNSNYMYNPNYIKAYSAEEIRDMQRKYESLEKQWSSEMTKMKEYYKKCQSGGENQVKSYYIAEAKKVQDSMKALAEEMQYYKAITQNAKHNNDQILDLHGLTSAGALRVLKEFLRVKEEEFVSAGTPKMFLLVITGHGKHSKNGCPVLQPAVRNYLAQKNYRFFPPKPGCFQIILTRSTINQKKR